MQRTKVHSQRCVLYVHVGCTVRQLKGLTTSHINIHLDPFVTKLTSYDCPVIKYYYQQAPLVIYRNPTHLFCLQWGLFAYIYLFIQTIRWTMLTFLFVFSFTHHVDVYLNMHHCFFTHEKPMDIQSKW